jgi:hypothetical protein
MKEEDDDEEEEVMVVSGLLEEDETLLEANIVGGSIGHLALLSRAMSLHRAIQMGIPTPMA